MLISYVTIWSLQHYLYRQNTRHQFDISQLCYEHTQTIRHIARGITEPRTGLWMTQWHNHGAWSNIHEFPPFPQLPANVTEHKILKIRSVMISNDQQFTWTLIFELRHQPTQTPNATALVQLKVLTYKTEDCTGNIHTKERWIKIKVSCVTPCRLVNSRRHSDRH
jgi:hypothetical protein